MKKQLVCLTLPLLLTACVNFENKKYTPAESDALKVSISDSDSARIFFSSGFFMPTTVNRSPHRFPVTLYIDDTKIGSVQSGETLAFKVVPATYKVRWVYWSGDKKPSGAEILSVETSITAQKGESIMLYANYDEQINWFSPTNFGGVVGLLAQALVGTNPSTAVIVPETDISEVNWQKLVKPDNCPDTICR